MNRSRENREFMQRRKRAKVQRKLDSLMLRRMGISDGVAHPEKGLRKNPGRLISFMLDVASRAGLTDGRLNSGNVLVKPGGAE